MIDENLIELSFTEQLDEESFDELVKRLLESDSDDYSTEKTVTGMMLRTALTTANLITNFQDYGKIINDNEDPTRIQTLDDFIVHPHDIIPIDCKNFMVIPYRDFYMITNENEFVYRNILALKYKNENFTVNVLSHILDSKSFEKSYDRNNIALFFVPITLKRMAGKASENGKDIIKIYGTHLLTYGYKINGKRIDGISHKPTIEDASFIIKSLRIINNELHK
jgi:hypothetical protein